MGTNYSLQILACAIVVTIALGCLKLLYAHWRLRKCSAIAEQERQELAMQQQMSQRRKVAAGNESGSDDTPFGIRALESGVEVEGVWISRSNTPELPGSEDASPTLSMSEYTPRKDFNIDLEKQHSQTRSMSGSTTATKSSGQRSHDRMKSVEKLPSGHASRDSSLDPPLAKPPRPKYPPVSFQRYNGSQYVFMRQSNTNTTLQALESIYKASTAINGEDTSSSDSSTQITNTDDRGPISSSASSLLTYHQPRPRPRHQSPSDLEILNKHRTSQVAEQGQLTPRGRPAGKALSMDSYGPNHPRKDSASLERSDYFSTGLKNASATSVSSSPTNTCSSPKIDALSAAVRRSSMPNVTPFTEFIKRTSQSARPEGLRSQSRDSAQSATPKSPSQSRVESGPSSPIIPASEGAAELKLPPPVVARTSFEHEKTRKVIRGHGTGFEILRPGSLNGPSLSNHMNGNMKSLPPVSLQNSTRTHRSSTCGTETMKKLQKKRQGSASTASSDTSRLSRISLFS